MESLILRKHRTCKLLGKNFVVRVRQCDCIAVKTWMSKNSIEHLHNNSLHYISLHLYSAIYITNKKKREKCRLLCNWNMAQSEKVGFRNFFHGLLSYICLSRFLFSLLPSINTSCAEPISSIIAAFAHYLGVVVSLTFTFSSVWVRLENERIQFHKEFSEQDVLILSLMD